MNWAGDNPLYMVLQTLTDVVVIDLDERGWKATYNEELSEPGTRSLVRKDDNEVVLERFCRADQSVTYHSKVFGYFGGPQVRAYGLEIYDPSEGVTFAYWAPWDSSVVESVQELVATATHQLASLGRRGSDIVVPGE